MPYPVDAHVSSAYNQHMDHDRRLLTVRRSAAATANRTTVSSTTSLPGPTLGTSGPTGSKLTGAAIASRQYVAATPGHNEGLISQKPPTTGTVKDDRLTMPVEEAAQLLGLSLSATYQAIVRGEIPAIKIGRRVLVKRRLLIAMISGTA